MHQVNKIQSNNYIKRQKKEKLLNILTPDIKPEYLSLVDALRNENPKQEPALTNPHSPPLTVS